MNESKVLPALIMQLQEARKERESAIDQILNAIIRIDGSAVAQETHSETPKEIDFVAQLKNEVELIGKDSLYLSGLADRLNKLI